MTHQSPPRIASKPVWTIATDSWFLPLTWPFILMAYAAALHWHEYIAGFMKPPGLDCDFLNMWGAAKLAASGHVMDLFNLRIYNVAIERFVGHAIPLFYTICGTPKELGLIDWAPRYNWLYPPHVIPLLLPLGLLSYPWALATWFGVTFCLYAFAVAAGRPAPWSLALVLLLSSASIANIDYGQYGFFTGALLVGGLRLLDKRPVLAGILFGILTIKPQLGLLLPLVLILNRSWKTIAAAAITAMLLIGLSLILYGIAPWQAYVSTAMPIMTNILNDSHPRVMMVTPFITMRLVSATLAAAYAVHALCALWVVLCVWQAYASRAPAELKAAILLLAALIVSPYAFNYDMTVTNAAVVAIFALRAYPQGGDSDIAPGFQAQALRNVGLDWRMWLENALLICVWAIPTFVSWVNQHVFPLTPLALMTLLYLQTEKLRSLTHPMRQDCRDPLYANGL